MTISITPYYRADREKVVLRIIADQKVLKNIDLGIKIKPEHWDATAREVKGHTNARLLNTKIQNKVHELQATFAKAEIMNTTLTPARIKSMAEGKVATGDFYSFCANWLPDKYTNYESLKQANTSITKLKEFSPMLSFGDVDQIFLKKYLNFLMKRGNAENTVWKEFKFLRTMFNDAKDITHGKNPVSEFIKANKLKYENPEKDGLYIHECNDIEKLLDSDCPVIVKIVAARFLFMCYSGLRLSDAKRFSAADHIKDGDRLSIKTKKQGTVVNFKVHEKLARIINIMQELPNKPMSDQYFNEWLKTVADLSGVTRIKLTSHVGRHTLGCLLAEAEVQPEEARTILGHKKIDSTMIYYKLRQGKIDKAVRKLDNL